MTADDLDIIVSSVAPVMREFVASRLEGMLEKVAGLEQRLMAAEHRSSVVPKDGADGKDGSSFRSGSGPPSCEGLRGDVYLDAKTGDVYQWL